MENADIVQIAFGDDPGPASQLGGLLVKPVAQFSQNVADAEVENSVDGIQAKRIEVVFGHPIERVVDDKAADSIAAGVVVVYRASPRGAVLICEIRSELTQVVAFRTGMIVNNVQHNGEARLMASIHEALQAQGTAVGRVGRV